MAQQYHYPPNPWSKNSYPSQTWHEPSPKSRQDSILTLAVSTEESNTKLPKIIRAVRSARDSDSLVRTGRTLVVCLDGTGDSFDNDNSNVVNFVACLKKDDPSQLTYYQSGIGTYDGSGLKSGFSASLDMAVGSGLGTHVKDAYRFLMQNYNEGDKICLLGFSRGSYTVRCLAGMLHKVGLLPADNSAQVPFAYAFYKNDSDEGWDMSREFKRTFCMNVSVYFVGIWDCVASVGFIPRKLPFSKNPTNSIAYFRHAMALDERRSKFKVCQWQHRNPVAQVVHLEEKDQIKVKGTEISKVLSRFGSGRKDAAQIGIMPSTGTTQPANGSIKPLKRRNTLPIRLRSDKEKEKEDDKNEEKFDLEASAQDCPFSDHKPKTDVKEVWFAGAHADVGGGAELNESRHMLARIPLRWMIRQTFECETGILFSTASLAETGLDVSALYPVYKSIGRPVVGPSPSMVEIFEENFKKGELPSIKRRSSALGIVDEKDTSHDGQPRASISLPKNGIHSQQASLYDLLPEHVEDHFDAMCGINDQLVMAKGWWVLEFWPVKGRFQKKGSNEWEKKLILNMGRHRAVREMEPKMHWTVHLRINDKKCNYKLGNKIDPEAIWQIDN